MGLTPQDAIRQIKTLLDQVDLGTAASPPPPTPPVATPPSTSSGPLGATGSFKLVFQDEFAGTSLDTTKWRLGPIWAAAGGAHGYNGTEKGWYSPSQVSVRNGLAVLTAERKPGGENMAYSTGTITTAPDKYGVVKKDWKPAPATFEFTYGWVEARIKLPKGKGLWPALWLLRSDEVWPPEIDILEVVDPQCRKVAQHFHYGPQGKDTDFTKNTNLGLDTGIDLSLDFHVFAVDWQPEYIRWYLDGHLTQEYTDKAQIPNKAMYILANLAVGGQWPGDPDSSTVFPAEMQIDRVSVWERA